MVQSKKFGQISVWDFPPLVLSYRLLTSPWNRAQSYKTWRRVISDVVTGHLSRMKTHQIQAVVGDSLKVFNDFAKQANIPSNIETLESGLQIAWIGPKRTDRVVLYLHGGGFTLFAPSCGLNFLYFVQQELFKRGLNVGFAVPLYTLYPTATFPSPLRETVTAVDHILKSGVSPKNLTFVGDSAGGSIILQLFSHMLHRHPLVEPFALPPGTKFGGAFLMSPWVSLTGQDPNNSFDECADTDVVHADILKQWGVDMMKGIPDDQHMYMEAVYAPDSWFEGVDWLVDSIMVSVGELEAARDSIVNFYDAKFRKWHRHSELIRQERGVHVDPFYDFFFGSPPKDLGTLTPRIIEWMHEVYKTD